MRIAILWTRLSGYLNICLKELASREGVEIFVSHEVAGSDAPFDDVQFSWMSNRISWRTERDLDPLNSRLDAFDPEILIFAGWHIRPYRKAARAFANRSWRVMTMDNCWRATPRQIAGRWIAWVYLLPLAGAVWLPGDRQSIFARRLGFDQQMILRGLYSCDQTAMEAPQIARVTTNRPVPRSFLFLGRFVPEKRTDMLLKAYELYRDNTLNPWPLVCCGAGPLQSELEGKRGIQVKGFVQPERIPEVLASAGCLVLPSQFEPWGLVVHEAASAGLAILASEKVGAVPHLVQPGYNGFIFGISDVVGLATLMSQVSAMGDAQLDEMSRAIFFSHDSFPQTLGGHAPRSFCSEQQGCAFLLIPVLRMHRN